MSFLIEMFSGNIGEAIGWTIFHSIWQGLLVSIILGISILAVNNKSAKFRYAISVVSLFLIFVSSVITFSKVYNPTENKNEINFITKPINNEINEPVLIVNSKIGSTGSLENLLNNIKPYLEKYLSSISAAWFAGLMIFSLRFFGGVFYIRRLRNKGILPVEEKILNQLQPLLQKVNYLRPVEILQSALVKIPVTFGYLKPVILLPLSFISGLPQNQLEAIVAHEIAHIKRYDFLVNIIQTITETIFFYHPLVWWISSVIRRERENCCDDFVIENFSDPLSYSNALVTIQEMKEYESSFALAAIGKESNLLRRIKRMNENKKTHLAYGIKFTAFAVLALFVAIVSIYSTKSYGNKMPNVYEASFINPAASINSLFTSDEENSAAMRDTANLRKGKHTFRFNEKDNGDKKHYKAQLNNGKLEDLYIDGVQIPDNEIGKYQEKIDQKIDDYSSMISEFKKNRENYKKFSKEYSLKMKEYRDKFKDYKNNRDDWEFDEEYPSPDLPEVREATRELRHELRESFADHSFIAPHIPPITIPEVDIPEIDVPEVHVPPIHIPPINFTPPHISNEFMDEWKDELKESMQELNENMKEHRREIGEFGDSMKVFSDNMKIFGVEMKKFGKFIKAAKNEMIDDNLVDSGNDIDSFYLSENEMAVNGKPVSPELRNKYLDMYKKYTGKKLTGDKKIEIDDWH